MVSINDLLAVVSSKATTATKTHLISSASLICTSNAVGAIWDLSNIESTLSSVVVPSLSILLPFWLSFCVQNNYIHERYYNDNVLKSICQYLATVNVWRRQRWGRTDAVERYYRMVQRGASIWGLCLVTMSQYRLIIANYCRLMSNTSE